DTSAQTASPSRQPVTSFPKLSIVPATSSPGMSDAPGGGGYRPSRCMTSGRFTPAAATRIRTSPADGAGRGRSVGTRTSGSPGSRIWMAIMFVTLRADQHKGHQGHNGYKGHKGTILLLFKVGLHVSTSLQRHNPA